MSDPRFARLKSDPRFRRPRKKQSKVVVDERFKSVFSNGKKGASGARIDKYGRPISDTHEQDNLKRFYRLQDGNEEEEPKRLLDYARGEVLLESSDEEERGQDVQDVSHPGAIIMIGGNHPQLIAVPADDETEINLDENAYAELDAQVAAYNETHPEVSQEDGTPTRRLAVVNLDWDHVRATHLFKICSSLVSPAAPGASESPRQENMNSDQKRPFKATSSNVIRGKVLSASIYASEFGKRRLTREEKEGPPSEIFKKRGDLEQEVNEQNIYEVGNEDEYDEDALRKYQLERLRYHYAIVTCDTVNAASHIYHELEGTELERSANVFDLSFVPDDMSFDAECRDEATAESTGMYKPVEFVTDALRHSKVKLTWDDDDQERNQVTRRNLTRKEIEDADFKAYLASSSSESETDLDQPDPIQKKKDKEASRDKLRALLLEADDVLPEGWGRDDEDYKNVDMEITFTPGLTEKQDQDETTIDQYQRKMREKRKKRKEEIKEKTTGPITGAIEDDFFETGSDDGVAGDSSANLSKGSDHKKKSRSRKEEKLLSTTTPEELVLVTSDKLNAEPNHFDMKAVIRAEKKSNRKMRKGKKKGGEDDHEIQEDFKINVNDDRFKALHEDHQFAIDPSNPHFKRTKGITSLLEERAKRQKSSLVQESVPAKEITSSAEKNLKSLVENVKRKSIGLDRGGTGKRRKHL